MNLDEKNILEDTDISKLSQAEIKALIGTLNDKIARMGKLLDEAQNKSKIGSYDLEIDGEKLIWSDHNFEILGLDKFLGEPTVEEYISFVLPADQQYLRNAIEKTISTGISFDITYRWKGKDGKIRFINSVGGLQVDEFSGRKRIVGTNQDVTDKKTIEEEIRQNAKKHQKIIETTHDGYFAIDKNGRILESNPAFEIMTGYSQNELSGMNISELEAVETKFDVREHIQKVINQGWDQFITKHKRKDGALISVDISTTCISSSEHVLICFARDVTSATIEKELLEARFRIEDYKQNHSLDQFLQKCLDEAEQLTGSKIGFYHFVDDDQEIISLQMWSTNTIMNMCTAKGKDSHYPVSKAGVWVDCIKKRKPVVHNDYQNLKHKNGLPEGHTPVIRELTVPVISGKKIKAILGVGNKPTNYTSADIEIVERLAGLAWDIVEQKRAEELLVESKRKYQNLFEEAPVPIWEEDFSELKKYLEGLKLNGIVNLRDYLVKNHDELIKCASLIQIINVNKASLNFFDVASIEELEQNLKNYFVDESWPVFLEEIATLSSGELKFESEIEIKDLQGKRKNLLLTISISKGSEYSWDHVIVSFLDISSRKMAEKKLEESEKRWQFALEGAEEGVWDWNLQTDEVFYSERLKSMLGYNEKEFGTSLDEWKKRVHPDDLESTLKILNDYFDGKTEYYESEHRLQCSDGSYKWILDRGKIVVYDNDRKPLRMIGTHSDIRRRKEVENALLEERRLFNNGKTVVFKWITVGKESQIVFVSPNIKEQFGYNPQTLVEHRIDYNPFIHPDDVDRVKAEVKSFIEKNIDYYEQEYRIKHADGAYRWVYDFTKIEKNEDGAITHFNGYVHDISERKLAEKMVRDSEEKYRDLFEGNKDPIVLFPFDETGKVHNFSQVNRAACELLEYSVVEYMNLSAYDVEVELTQEKIYERMNRLMTDGIATFETLLIHKNGSIIPTEMKTSFVEINNKKYLMTIARDITERKRTEEILRKSEAKYHNLFDSITDAIVIIEINENEELGAILEINNRAASLLGYTKEELMNLSPYTLEADLSTEKLFVRKENLVKYGAYNFEASFIHKDGHKIPMEVNATVVMYNNKTAVMNFARDISERKETEQKLAESEAQFRVMFNEHSAVMLQVDPESGKILDANISAVKFYGYPAGVLTTLTVHDLNTLSPEKVDEFRKKIVNGTLNYLVFKHKLANGKIRDVEVYSKQVKAGGKPILFSIIHDITERKQAEIALLESEQNLTTLINSTPDIICFKDGEGRWLKANDGILSLYELIGVDYYNKTEWELADFTHPVYQDGFKTCGETDAVAWKYGVQSRSEEVILRSNGERRTYDIIKIPIFNPDGSRKALVVLGRDISERKIIENELKQSEDKFRLSFMTSPDSININRMHDGMYIEVNEGFTRMTGFTLEDVKGKTSAEISIWANLDDRKRLVSELMENGSCTNLEAKFRFKDGTIRTGLMSASPIMVNGEKCILSITRDITERKQTEDALRESEDKFKTLFEMSPDAIFLHKGKSILYANEAAVKLLKYPNLAELQKTLAMDIVHPDYRFIIEKRILSMKKSGEPAPPLYEKYVCYDGSIVDVEVTASELLINGEKTYQVLARDISERIRSDKRIKLQRDMNLALLSTRDINEAAKLIFTYARKILEVDSGGIYLSTKEGGFKIVDSFGVSNKFQKFIKYHAPDSRNAEIAMKGNTYFISYEEIKNSENKELYQEGLKSAAIMPMLLEGKVAAVLNLASHSTEKFADEQKSLIESFASQCGAYLSRLIAEQELKASEDKFRKFFEADLAGDYKSSLDGTLLECNAAFARILEFDSKEQALATNMNDIYPQSKNRNSFISKLRKEKKLELIETRLVTRKGRVIIVLENVLADFDENNKLVGFTGYMIDVTQLKLSERALKESEKNYRELFSRMQSGFAYHEIITNRLGKPVNYRFISMNQAFEKLTGLKASKIIGETVLDLMPNTEKYWIDTYGKVALTGKPISYENYSKELGKYYRVVAYSPEKYKFATIIEDITERIVKDKELEDNKNRLEAEVDLRTRDLQLTNIRLNDEIAKQKNTEELLKDSLAKEKELNELKSRFISTTSHEFRTPLASVLSSTELLQKYGKKWSEDKFAEHVDRTKRAVEYLVKLLDDVLTISRTESGKINFSPELFDLKLFCQEIIKEAASNVTEKHKFIFEYKLKKKEFNLDPKLLKFILLNLVVNALKYSPAGGEVKLIVNGDRQKKNNINFAISDKGIGIPEDEKPYIYDNFHRSRNSVDIPGTGLGLSIVKRSVELHHGTISLVSKLNVGTTFFVALPKQLQVPKKEKVEATKS